MKKEHKNISVCGLKTTGMDSSAAFLGDRGEILFFSEDERYNRQKYGWDTDSPAYRYFMDKFETNDDFELVIPISPNFLLERQQRFIEDNLTGYRLMRSLEVSQKRFDISWNVATKVLGVDPSRIKLCSHHVAHAASSFYPSGFEESAILVMDGQAEKEWMSLGSATLGNIDFYRKDNFIHSLGKLYSKITDWLGLGAIGSEWKTMGLASYGQASFKDHFICGADGTPPVVQWDHKTLELTCSMEHFHTLFGESDPVVEKPTQRQCDIAASIQAVFEDYLLAAARNLKEETGLDRLCFAGGLAYNCKANQRLIESGLFKDIFIFPAAGDAGTSVGAALHRYHQLNPTAKASKRLVSLYTGSIITGQDAENAVKDREIPYRKSDNAAAEIAEALAEGSIVGVARGGMEAGPRALGNRSILANPRDPGMKDKINAVVKYREFWRPFAPIVLDEDVARFFDESTATPFMITTSDVIAPEDIGAVVHVDGTSRLQVVTADSNPFLYDLLIEFKKRTGAGVLLNTSFNLKGEPIVRTAEDATDTFLRCAMDVLAVDNLLVERGAHEIPVLDKGDTIREPRSVSLKRELAAAERVLLFGTQEKDGLITAVKEIQAVYPGAAIDILDTYGLDDAFGESVTLIPYEGVGFRSFYLSGIASLRQSLDKPYTHIVHAATVQSWYYITYLSHYANVIEFIDGIRSLQTAQGYAKPDALIFPERGLVKRLDELRDLYTPVFNEVMDAVLS